MDKVQVLALGMVAAIRVMYSLRRDTQVGSSEDDRVRRLQYGVRPWPIAQLPENELGRMVGNVRALERTLTAPLTGRPCVYYLVVVEQPRRGGWVECFTERRAVAFTLEDPSGHAIIEPANAAVALAFDHREDTRAPEPAATAQEALLARHRHEFGSEFRRLQFHEAVLSVGERVTVVGAGHHRPYCASSAEADYRSSPPMRLHIAGSDAAPLSISSHCVR